MKPEDIFNQECARVGYTPTPARHSTLLVNGQEIASGLSHVDQFESTILFYPQSATPLDIPDGQASLTLKDTKQSIALSSAELCQKGLYLHYHLRVRPQNP
jgi:hypothetical protein